MAMNMFINSHHDLAPATISVSNQIFSIVPHTCGLYHNHYDDVIMSAMASQITSIRIVYPTVYSGADQRKHPSSASLAFVEGIHRSPVNSTHKRPITRKMFPFDDVIMLTDFCLNSTTRRYLFTCETTSCVDHVHKSSYKQAQHCGKWVD